MMFKKPTFRALLKNLNLKTFIYKIHKPQYNLIPRLYSLGIRLCSCFIATLLYSNDVDKKDEDPALLNFSRHLNLSIRVLHQICASSV